MSNTHDTLDSSTTNSSGTSGGKKSILFVEDMLLFREPMVLALQAHGYAVLTATSGAEALEMMNTTRPDLVLLDLGIPVLDGLTVLKKTRGLREQHPIPVIVLTASADRDSVVRAGELGARDYILKSQCTVSILLSRIARQLNPRGATPAPAPAGRHPANAPGAALQQACA